MAKSGRSRADENRAIRQEELRAKLAAGGHIEHVIEISNKLANLNEVLEPNEVVRLKAAADIKNKIISKYIPDMKSIEHSGEIRQYDPNKLTDEELANIATSGSEGTASQTDSQTNVH